MTWSEKHKSCVKCNTTVIPHLAKGKCSRCYLHEYRKNNQDKARKYGKEWYKKNRIALKEHYRKNRNDFYYDGNREKVLQRDGYKCTECKSTKNLIVHHKNEKSKYAKKKNADNRLDNLITLCRRCHVNVHQKQLLKSRMDKFKKRWAWHYDRCEECGTTKRKHAGRGLCKNCYARFRNSRKDIV